MRTFKERLRFRAIVAGVMVLLLVLSACSASQDAADQSEPMQDVGYDDALEDMDVSFSEAFDDGVEMELAAEDAKQTSYEGATDGSEGESRGFAPIEGEQGFHRQIIYRANMTMEVADYAEAQSQVKDLLHVSDGYILQFSEMQSNYELGGNYVLKVPAVGFSSFIDSLDAMNPLSMQKNVQGQDVTEEYVDLSSRLAAKEVVEARLLSFMENAQNAEDLVSFSRELASVQEEIEQIKGRMRYLDQNVAYATVELRLYEKIEASATKKNERSLYERASQAMDSSLKFLGEFFQGLIVFLAGAIPVLLVLVLLFLPFYFAMRRWSTKRRRTTDQTKEVSSDSAEDTTTD